MNIILINFYGVIPCFFITNFTINRIVYRQEILPSPVRSSERKNPGLQIVQILIKSTIKNKNRLGNERNTKTTNIRISRRNPISHLHLFEIRSRIFWITTNFITSGNLIGLLKYYYYMAETFPLNNDLVLKIWGKRPRNR